MGSFPIAITYQEEIEHRIDDVEQFTLHDIHRCVWVWHMAEVRRRGLNNYG